MITREFRRCCNNFQLTTKKPPSVSFRSNSFTICRPSPMLVQKMSIPDYGDLDSLGISTSTRLPDSGYKTLPRLSQHVNMGGGSSTSCRQALDSEIDTRVPTELADRLLHHMTSTEIHDTKKKREKYKVSFARQERLRKAPIHAMRRILNDDEEGLAMVSDLCDQVRPPPT